MFDTIPSWVIRPVARVAENWNWLGGQLSNFIINRAVNSTRNRPHPWSTLSDYTSWQSLTDRTWSARHLPAYYNNRPLPDPASVAEMFRRPDGGQRLCSKSTCLFPAFAQYLTDGFIRTIPDDSDAPPERRRRGTTSNHEIDLCPLYGRSIAQTHALRVRSETRGERGRMQSQRINSEEFAPFLFQDDGTTPKPQFARLDPPLGLGSLTDPALRAAVFAFGGDRANAVPHVALINTLWLREHNRLAGELDRANPQWDDERVFQTARNIVIVLFIKIVVEEYINHIAPTPFRLRADPRVAWTADWNRPNWITAEFSLLYRWHSLIPDEMRWGQTLYPVAALRMDNRPLLTVGLARGCEDLSAQKAGELGPFNTAAALVPLEQFALLQGQLNNIAPYAHYRQLMGLPAPKRFENISSRPEVVDLLRRLYTTPSNVEFYTGLFAEDRVPNSPLPELILRFVAVDAFSQAFTNPLLSQHVYGEHGKETFTPLGLDCINQTHALRDVLMRNVTDPASVSWIGMTQRTWEYQW